MGEVEKPRHSPASASTTAHQYHDIRNLMTKTEQEISALGDERPTVGHLRMFLSRLAMQFHNLVTSALNGTYHEADSIFFGGQGADNSNRLRARVHQLNQGFSDYMRESGQRRRVVEQRSSDDLSPEEPNDGQILVTESEMKEWVKQVCEVSSRDSNLLSRIDICQQQGKGAPGELQPCPLVRNVPSSVM